MTSFAEAEDDRVRTSTWMSRTDLVSFPHVTSYSYVSDMRSFSSVSFARLASLSACLIIANTAGTPSRQNRRRLRFFLTADIGGFLSLFTRELQTLFHVRVVSGSHVFSVCLAQKSTGGRISLGDHLWTCFSLHSILGLTGDTVHMSDH